MVGCLKGPQKTGVLKPNIGCWVVAPGLGKGRGGPMKFLEQGNKHISLLTCKIACDWKNNYIRSEISVCSRRSILRGLGCWHAHWTKNMDTTTGSVVSYARETPISWLRGTISYNMQPRVGPTNCKMSITSGYRLIVGLSEKYINQHNTTQMTNMIHILFNKDLQDLTQYKYTVYSLPFQSK